MKNNNKGFSMVELIIVIAIMAILAGALAPALIKYINKSRISTDIQTGQTIASAIQTALSNELAYDDCSDASTLQDYGTFYGAQGTNMKSELGAVIGANTPAGKAKKDVAGSSADQKFYVKMVASTNLIEVYAGGTTANHMVYPTVGSCWQ